MKKVSAQMIFLVFIFLSGCSRILQEQIRSDTLRIKGMADKIFERIRHQDPIWGNYTIDLAFESLLEIYQMTGDRNYRDYVLAVMYRRNIRLDDTIPYRDQPFGHLNYKLYEVTGDQHLVAPFIAQSLLYFYEISRTYEGMVLHRGTKGTNILIDSMQDYATRMARLGKLIGAETFFQECVKQFSLHRYLLRNPNTGLWSQGRGWEEHHPSTLSPGAWSRGHGWLLRGLVNSMMAVPQHSEYFLKLNGYLLELFDTLLPLQDNEGMWHVLLDRPLTDSPPETSGTAMIAWALFKALQQKFIQGEAYWKSANKAFASISRLVDEKGMIHGVCPGPGTLNSEYYRSYLHTKFSEDEHHGWFSVLYAFAGKLAMIQSARE